MFVGSGETNCCSDCGYGEGNERPGQGSHHQRLPHRARRSQNFSGSIVDMKLQIEINFA
jgi:hypothetical protein